MINITTLSIADLLSRATGRVEIKITPKTLSLVSLLNVLKILF